MRISNPRRLAAALVAALATAATASSAASAAPANWVTSGNATFTGTNVTLTKDGLQPKVCPTFSMPGTIGNNATPQGVFAMSPSAPGVVVTCAGQPFRVFVGAYATVDAGAYALNFFDPYSFTWGQTLWAPTNAGYRFKAFTVPFTNPVGTAKATLTFNDTPIADFTSGGTIRMTGTLTANSTSVALTP